MTVTMTTTGPPALVAYLAANAVVRHGPKHNHASGVRRTTRSAHEGGWELQRAAPVVAARWAFHLTGSEAGWGVLLLASGGG
jgi:hypothetical protein